MSKYFLNGAFYDTSLFYEGDLIAGGAKPISDELYAQVVTNRPPSKMLGVDENGLPVLCDPPPPLAYAPQSVTMRQGKEALIRRGKFTIVDNYIAAMTGIEGDIARNEWKTSQVIERSRPLTLQMFALIGVNDDAARDEWFIYAATL